MTIRPANAIDFWRGSALIMIFINHVPGTIFSRFTLHDFAISDGAEMFVFFAGCSLVYVAGLPGARKPIGVLVRRMLKRAAELWAAQFAMLWSALFLLSAFAIGFEAPELYYWHGAGPAFYDTADAFLGSLMLTYQMGYFNILPLYVAMLVIACIPLAIARTSRLAALAVSLTLYVVALTYQLNLMNWPTRGSWHFNPLAWQLNLVIGFLVADLHHQSPAFRDLIKRAWPYATVLVVLGAYSTYFRVWPDTSMLPGSKLFYGFDKGWLAPSRMVSMLALAVAFYGAFARIKPHMPRLVESFASLGRNSLPVFCAGSLLSLTAQMVRYLIGPSFPLDAVLIATGIALMLMVARASDTQWLSRTVQAVLGDRESMTSGRAS